MTTSIGSSRYLKPLLFDIGYFTYRYLYSENQQEMDIDFSKIIPANVNKKTRVANIEFTIKLLNTSNYIMPVITDCYTLLKRGGSVTIRTQQHSTPFRLACGNQSYTLMSSMETELTFQLSNVLLSELRDQAIRFKVNYVALPRVLSGLTGSFESNTFEHSYISLMREHIEYEWRVHVPATHRIRLTLDALLNADNIVELSVSDGVRNIQLYDQNELVDNFQRYTFQAANANAKSAFSYVFATNNIRIRFVHLKQSKTRTSKYPYVKFSYVAESRLLDFTAPLAAAAQQKRHKQPQPQQAQNQQQQQQQIDLNFNSSWTKDKLEWLVIAPRDHVVIASVVAFGSLADATTNGQLKFSLLGSGYSDNGTYYFDLSKRQQPSSSSSLFITPQRAKYERDTDIVASSGNMMRVEYASGGPSDSFRLVFTYEARVLDKPCGMIRPHVNAFTQPLISVPKLTDQSWTVRAPYGKQVSVYTRFVDLLGEETCTRARLDFLDANGTALVAAKCGHQDIESNAYDLDTATLLSTRGNELLVRFTTQNTNEVVYANTVQHVDDANDPQNEHDQFAVDTVQVYRGFLYYYAIVEQPGDCFFQTRKSIMCDYENVVHDKVLYLHYQFLLI